MPRLIEKLDGASLIRLFDKSQLSDEQEKMARDRWPHYNFDHGRAAAFFSPPDDFQKHVTQTKEIVHWPSVDSIYDIMTHNVVSRLLNRSVHSWLMRSGCKLYADYRSYYLPSPFHEESIYRFKDVDDKQSYIRVAGSVRLYRPNASPEVITHHPMIRFMIRLTDSGAFVVQLRPGVALFDAANHAITGRKVGPRTKKVTRAYFNEKWRKRLMAFSQLLTQTAANDAGATLSLGSLVTLSTDWSLDESSFSADALPETDEPVQEDVEVTAEEMEDSNHE